MNNQTKKKFMFLVDDKDFKTSSYTNPGGIITRCVRVAKMQEGFALRDSKDKKKIQQPFSLQQKNGMPS